MSTEKLRLPSYGGQALLEGVLMRGKNYVAAAMRAPTGEIVITTEKLSNIYRSPIRKIPFLRGLILLWDALVLGMRFLVKSANIQSGEDEQIEGSKLYLTLGFSFLIMIALFYALPVGIGHLLETVLKSTSNTALWVENIIRTILIIGYMWAIGKMPEISSFFGYHGAEHKTINAFEAGSDMTPESVSRYSMQHPRCGTGFLLTVAIISFIVFMIIGPLPFFYKFISRIVLIPVIAMLAYEYMRWTANHIDNPVIKWLVWPNLMMQNLTTREPTLEMIEVSLAAFNRMLEEENQVQSVSS